MEYVRIRVAEPPAENVSRYYEIMQERFERGIITQHLQFRAEAGSTRSERGYQKIGASTCGRIARALGCSEARTTVLCQAVGLYFPNYGQEGIRAVKRYIKERGLHLDPEMLGRDAVLYSVHSIRWPIIGHFYRSVQSYFAGESDPEIDIVRLVQETIKKVKIAEHFYEGYAGDLLFDVSQELVHLAEETGRLEESRFLKQYEAQITAYEPVRLTEEQIQDEFKVMDHYIDVFGHHPEGLEHHNLTPEEGLLMYIHMHPYE